MQQNTHRARYPVSVETFWKDLCLNLDYQQELFMECLGCESMEVVKNAGDLDSGVERSLRFRKPIDAPSAVRKMFGNAVTMEEHGTFDPKTQSFSFTYRPPMLADRLHITGRTRVEPAGDGVEVITDTQFRCDLFGLGSILERFACSAGLDGQLDKERFTQRYIAKMGL